MAITEMEKRKRARASYEKRRAKKPVETLVGGGDLSVTYDPNSGDVTIRNGVQGVILTNEEAIVMRDALLDRLA